jgi:putative membrane protein
MNEKEKWLAISLVALVAFSALVACNRDGGVEAAREAGPPSVSLAEQDFTMKAMQGHLAEINTARIALQKTDNTDVADFAHMIQSDHNGALKDLSDLMKDKNVPQARTLVPEVQEDISRMNNLTGPEFDREFVNMMVSDHQKAVEMFRDQEAIAQNSDVKDYVEDWLPKLEMHLDKAKQLQSKLFSQPAKKH